MPTEIKPDKLITTPEPAPKLEGPVLVDQKVVGETIYPEGKGPETNADRIANAWARYFQSQHGNVHGGKRIMETTENENPNSATSNPIAPNVIENAKIEEPRKISTSSVAADFEEAIATNRKQ